MTDTLERRLADLPIAVPADLVSRSLAGARHGGTHLSRLHPRRRRRLVGSVSALAVGLAGNGVGAYYAPGYGQALANVPVLDAVSGPVLRNSGLAAADVSVFNDSSSSAGHTLQLVAAYADALRTVLFVRVDGRPLEAASKTSHGYFLEGAITDQFGHSYHQAFGPEQGSASTFEPLTGLARKLGARLTFHVTQISQVGSAVKGEPSPVPGAWTLRLTLLQQPEQAPQHLAAVHLDQATYTFTSVRVAAHLVDVRWKVTGPAVERALALAYGNGGPGVGSGAAGGTEWESLRAGYFFPALTSPEGQTAQVLEFGTEYPRGGAASGQIQVVVSGPGHYRLTMGSASGASDVRDVEVR